MQKPCKAARHERARNRLKSLSAVGAQHEAKFYADLFARQDAETFAMLVLDPRCLKDPLLEPLIAALRILSNLKLSPTLVVGALGRRANLCEKCRPSACPGIWTARACARRNSTRRLTA